MPVRFQPLCIAARSGRALSRFLRLMRGWSPRRDRHGPSRAERDRRVRARHGHVSPAHRSLAVPCADGIRRAAEDRPGRFPREPPATRKVRDRAPVVITIKYLVPSGTGCRCVGGAMGKFRPRCRRCLARRASGRGSTDRCPDVERPRSSGRDNGRSRGGSRRPRSPPAGGGCRRSDKG